MTVRPIAGTRRRGRSPEEDEALARELLADEKERAEHVMLVDLGRNDVGRVANVGTVRVVRNMEVDRYSHVMHIVSEVTGAVPSTVPPTEVLRAAFPAGTLSGAPKLRAMQIIRELEGAPARRLRRRGRLPRRRHRFRDRDPHRGLRKRTLRGHRRRRHRRGEQPVGRGRGDAQQSARRPVRDRSDRDALITRGTCRGRR